MDKAAGRRRMLNDEGEGIQRSSGSRREGHAGRRRSGRGHGGLDGGAREEQREGESEGREGIEQGVG